MVLYMGKTACFFACQVHSVFAKKKASYLPLNAFVASWAFLFKIQQCSVLRSTENLLGLFKLMRFLLLVIYKIRKQTITFD